MGRAKFLEKLYYWLLISFDIFNFVIFNIEIFAGINFASAVTETLYFLHPADCEHFGSSFPIFMCP